MKKSIKKTEKGEKIQKKVYTKTRKASRYHKEENQLKLKPQEIR